jgi:AraC family transcriptional regulator
MPIKPMSADSRRAEYAARFNRVVDHIQAHLAEPLDLETLAGVACFSPFHFHRLFHGWMGETIHEFINRLRVERAAAQLLYAPGKSITEIALDCGFSSSSTFARAFKAFHGLSASQWRHNRKIGNADRKICKAEDPGQIPCSSQSDESLSGEASTMVLSVEVKQFQPMHVAYIRHVGSFQENAALFERLFGRIRAWAGARGLLAGPSVRFLSVHHDNPEMAITAVHKLRMDAAVTVPEGTRVDGEISRQRLDGGAYAVSRVRISSKQFMAAWDALMSGWLPGSGFQPDDRPCFEIYLNEAGNDPEGMHEVEMCLAVKPL